MPSYQNREVADSYWFLAYERQNIFFRRLEGLPPPFSKDEILQQYSFTNAYRASDRVSQYLIKEVIYSGDDSPEEVLFRTLLFKIFNSIETWEGLKSHLPDISLRTYSYILYDDCLKAIKHKNGTIYSSAYIMPSGSTFFGSSLKHQNNLMMIEKMFEGGIVDLLSGAESLKQVYLTLLSYPSIGPFLAYQYAIDINYGSVIDFDESDFVVAGPGARSGLKKYFGNLKKGSEEDLILELAENQHVEFERRGLEFRNLWGRDLKPIDIQNLFCEVDKYTRVKLPDVQGVGNRKRIKRKYRPGKKLALPWYPPKWRLNKRIKV